MTGQPGHDSWDRTAEQFSLDRSARQVMLITSVWTRQRGEDGQNMTARKIQLGQDNLNRTTGTK
jgi:hypothetical protein